MPRLMLHRLSENGKASTAIFAGILVGISGAAVDLAVVPLSKDMLIHQLIGDFISALVAALLYLSLQLRTEGLHHRVAMGRAATVSELNHHIRNAVFPMCLAVQRTGDAESQRLSNEAVERINIAMRDAVTDVFAMSLQQAASVISFDEQKVA
jgi:hypothetical protein